LQMDYYIHDHMEEFSSIQSFRYFNVYGDGEDHKGDQASPVHKFSKQIKETGKLKLFEGSDKFLRDFIWVGDIVETVLNNDKPSGIRKNGIISLLVLKSISVYHPVRVFIKMLRRELKEFCIFNSHHLMSGISTTMKTITWF